MFCNSSELSITEIQNIPNKVQENINPDSSTMD